MSNHYHPIKKAEAEYSDKTPRFILDIWTIVLSKSGELRGVNTNLH